MTIVKIVNMGKTFVTQGATVQALDNINLEVERAEIISIFGPNGAGKSTLLDIIADIERPSSGSIERMFSRTQIVPYIFQDHRRSLLPWCSVKENITFPLKLLKISRREQDAKFEQITSMFDMEIDCRARVSHLSGGQAQTVSILRALVLEPEILVCDEPFSALDYHSKVFLQEKLMAVVKSFDITTFFVSHDLDESIFVGDRIVFLSSGPGRVREIIKNNMRFPRAVQDQTSVEFQRLKDRCLSVFSGE